MFIYKSGDSLYFPGVSIFTYEVRASKRKLSNTYCIVRPCFGELVKSFDNAELLNRVHVSINFSIYTNTNDPTFKQDNTRLGLDWGYFGSLTEFQSKLDILKVELQKYALHNMQFSSNRNIIRHGDTWRITDYSLFLVFDNVYNHELFFVLDMYRRLITPSSRLLTDIAYHLRNKNWHGLDLPSIMFLTDSFNQESPSDSLIGWTYLEYAKYITNFLTPKSFRYIREHITDNAISSQVYLEPLYGIALGPNNTKNILDIDGDDIYFDAIEEQLQEEYGLNVHVYRSDTIEAIEGKTTITDEFLEPIETYYQLLNKLIQQNL